VKKSAESLPLTEYAQAMDALQVQLAKVVGDQEKMVRLNAAESFVLEATPEQLRAICELPLVGAVRPNRTHRVVKPASVEAPF
jgi:hypothetical protein